MDCVGTSAGECERVIASHFEETRMEGFGVVSDVESSKVRKVVGEVR
jgi:hypothetical protein